jgi:hypothetical protein
VYLPAEGILHEEDEGDTGPNQSSMLAEGDSVRIRFTIVHGATRNCTLTFILDDATPI